MKKVLSFLAIIGGFVIAYTFVNGGLIEIQNFFKKDKIAKLELLETTLLAEQSKIEEKEDYILELRDELYYYQNSLETIEDIFAESDESNYMSDEEYKEYQYLYDLYNSHLSKYETLFEVHEREYEIYNNSIDEFNHKVREAQTLSEEIGATWIILPVGKRSSL